MKDGWARALDIGGRLLPDLVSWIANRIGNGESPEDVEVLARRMLATVQENRDLVDEMIEEKFPNED